MKKLLLLSILLAGTCGAVEYATSVAALGGLNKAMAGKQAGPVVDAWKSLINAYIREYGRSMTATELKEALAKISDRAFARIAELNKTTKEDVAKEYAAWLDESIEKKGVRKITPEPVKKPTEPVKEPEKPGKPTEPKPEPVKPGADWTDADWTSEMPKIKALMDKKPFGEAEKTELKGMIAKAKKLQASTKSDIVKSATKAIIAKMEAML